MIAALDRHLTYKWERIQLFHHKRQGVPLFQTSFRGESSAASPIRMGKRPNKARSLTEEEEEVLWEADKFGPKTPEALISFMWWLLTQFFGLRDRQEQTPRNENVSHFNFAKMTKVWSSCSLRPDRADCRTRTEIFNHECSLLEEVGVWFLSSSSLSSEDH